MRRITGSLAAVTVLAAAPVLTGCGGGGGAASGGRGTGTVRFVIRWPKPETARAGQPRSRVIPASTQSIDVSVQDGAGTQLAFRHFVRPSAVQATGQLDISNVPAGSVKVTANAYPNDDGSGVLQASGFVFVNVQPQQTANADLAMGSTVTHIAVFKDSDTVKVGDTLGVAVQALDASNQVVMTGSSDWQWTVDTNTYGAIAGLRFTGPFATVVANAAGSYVFAAVFTGTDPSQAPVQQSVTITVIGGATTGGIVVPIQ